MAGTSEQSGTVTRVAMILAAIADADGEIGVNQVAEKIGLVPSTVHRLLRLLKQAGLVEWNPSNHLYGPGREFHRIAARVIASADLPHLARPFLDGLVADFDETALLGLYLESHDAMTFALRVDGNHALQYRIDMNQPLSLLWGASGKAILAHLDDDVVRRIVANEKPAPAGGQPVPTYDELQGTLVSIRQTGFVISTGEKLSGAVGIAAPVLGSRGVVGCLCITSPIDRLAEDAVRAAALDVAGKASALSEVLGYQSSTTKTLRGAG